MGWLGRDLPAVRIMSNTSVLVNEAMSVISAGRLAGEELLRRMMELLRPVGNVLRIPETQQRAATAPPGSGPAYLYYLVEAMAEAQTGCGAATMLRESGERPVLLKEAVTSAAGTTASAVGELDKHRVRAAVLAAIEAARDRNRELGAEE
jgi:pyrroline-5-carboxylate reductase